MWVREERPEFGEHGDDMRFDGAHPTTGSLAIA